MYHDAGAHGVPPPGLHLGAGGSRGIARVHARAPRYLALPGRCVIIAPAVAVSSPAPARRATGRTGSCLLNGLIMGGSICQTLTKGDDQQCLDDPLMVSHLFHVHPGEYSFNRSFKYTEPIFF